MMYASDADEPATDVEESRLKHLKNPSGDESWLNWMEEVFEASTGILSIEMMTASDDGMKDDSSSHSW